jgi:hypothetical protein
MGLGLCCLITPYIRMLDPNEFGGLMHARVKILNPHANTPAAVKMNEIIPKYENTRKIHRLLTNKNPGLLCIRCNLN